MVKDDFGYPEKRKYECHICHQTFKKKESLEKHLKEPKYLKELHEKERSRRKLENM